MIVVYIWYHFIILFFILEESTKLYPLYCTKNVEDSMKGIIFHGTIENVFIVALCITCKIEIIL